MSVSAPTFPVSLPAVPETAGTLTLTDEARQAMVDHALAGLPNEACGLFSGTVGGTTVDAFHPMANAAASREIYLLDGQEQLEVERAVDEAGRAVLGVMHSHTYTEAYPSPTDVDDASRSDPLGIWFFVIVTLKDPDPAVRAYRILDGEITEVRVATRPG